MRGGCLAICLTQEEADAEEEEEEEEEEEHSWEEDVLGIHGRSLVNMEIFVKRRYKIFRNLEMI